MAETIHTFFPRLVDLHNYSPTSNTAQKFYNWQTLNQRVFRRLGFTLPKEMLEAAAMAEAWIVERILKLAREKMTILQERRAHSRLSQMQHHQSYQEVGDVMFNAATNHYNSPHLQERPGSALLALAQPGFHPPNVSTSWCAPAPSAVVSPQKQLTNNTNFMINRPASATAAVGSRPPSSSSPNPATTSMMNPVASTSPSRQVQDNNDMNQQRGSNPVSPLRPQQQQSPLSGTAQHNTARGVGTTGVGGVPSAQTLVELQELREMNQLLEMKVYKLEQLLRLKDTKVAALAAQLETVLGSKNNNVQSTTFVAAAAAGGHTPSAIHNNIAAAR